MEGGGGRLCNWVVLVARHVDYKLSSSCAAGIRSCCGEGVYSCCIVGGGKRGGDGCVVGRGDTWGTDISGCYRGKGGCGSGSDVPGRGGCRDLYSTKGLGLFGKENRP